MEQCSYTKLKVFVQSILLEQCRMKFNETLKSLMKFFISHLKLQIDIEFTKLKASNISEVVHFKIIISLNKLIRKKRQLNLILYKLR